MPTLTAGNSTTITLDAFQTVTITTPPNTEGSWSVNPINGGLPTSTQTSGRFGPPEVKSRAYGPFGCAVSFKLSCAVGSVDYATGQPISTGGAAAATSRKRRLAQILGQLTHRQIDLNGHEVCRLPSNWVSGTRYGRGAAVLGVTAGNTGTIYVCFGSVTVNSTTNQAQAYIASGNTQFAASTVEPVRDARYPYRLVRTSDGLVWAPFDVSSFPITKRASLLDSAGNPVVPTVTKRAYFDALPKDASNADMPIRYQSGSRSVIGTTAGAVTNSTAVTMSASFFSSNGSPIYGPGIPDGTTIVSGATTPNLVLSVPVTLTAGAKLVSDNNSGVPGLFINDYTNAAELASGTRQRKAIFSSLVFSPHATSLSLTDANNSYLPGFRTNYVTDALGAFASTATTGANGGMDVSFETAAKSVAIGITTLTLDGSNQATDPVPCINVQIDGVYVDVSAMQTQASGNGAYACWQWTFPDSRSRMFRVTGSLFGVQVAPATVWTSTEDTIHQPGYQSAYRANFTWASFGDSTWAGADPFPWSARNAMPGGVIGHKLGLGPGINLGQGGTGFAHPYPLTGTPNQSSRMNFIQRLYANQVDLDTRLGAPDLAMVVLDISQWDLPSTDARFTNAYLLAQFTQFLRDFALYQPNTVFFFTEPRRNALMVNGTGNQGFALDALGYPIPRNAATQDAAWANLQDVWRQAIDAAGLTSDQYTWISLGEFSANINETSILQSLGWVMGDGVHPNEWYAIQKGNYIASEIRRAVIAA